MALLDSCNFKLKYYSKETTCRISSHTGMNDKENGHDYLLTFDRTGFSFTVHVNEQSLVDLHEHIGLMIDKIDYIAKEEESIFQSMDEDYGHDKQVQAKLDSEVFYKTGGQGNAS